MLEQAKLDSNPNEQTRPELELTRTKDGENRRGLGGIVTGINPCRVHGYLVVSTYGYHHLADDGDISRRYPSTSVWKFNFVKLQL